MSLKKCLGFVEAKGLCAGVVAADTVVKAANVRLIGYEFARGDGWTTIKVEGNVGAVQAAVQAACAALNKMGKLATYKVIARPANALEMLTFNPKTVGYDAPAPEPTPEPPASPEKKTEESEDNGDELSEPEQSTVEDVGMPEPGSAVPSQPQEIETAGPEMEREVPESTEPEADTPSAPEAEPVAEDPAVTAPTETEAQVISVPESDSEKPAAPAPAKEADAPVAGEISVSSGTEVPADQETKPEVKEPEPPQPETSPAPADPEVPVTPEGPAPKAEPEKTTPKKRRGRKKQS